MNIIKRNGQKESVKFDKILNRVKSLSEDLKSVEPVSVAQKVVAGLFDGISSTKVDELLAETAALLNDVHPEYGHLAGRLIASSLHKETKPSFYQTMKDLYKEGALNEDFIEKVKKYSKELEKIIDYDRDLNFDFFGIKTLIGKPQGYLMRINSKIVERPQHLFMRVAVAIADDDINEIKKLYDMLSNGLYTHATPTLFNAGHKRPQYASCFLVQMEEDSIDGIFNTAKEAALISKYSGGIGIHCSNLRASGSKIKGNNGMSNGLVPWMKIFNEVARAVNQCFTPETLVYTTTGIKKIKDIVVGDEVIGQDGKNHRVTHQLSSPYSGKLLSLRINKSLEPVFVTPEHPFFVIKDQPKEQSYDRILKRLKSKAIGPEWVDAKDLTSDDLVAFPIPKFEQDIPEFSADDCRFYGMMLGDGHITKNGYECGITLGFSKDIDFVRNYLKLYQINYWENESEKKCLSIRWTNTPQFKIKSNMLYDENKEKRILPSFLHLPEEKTFSLIKGILETDGCIDNEISIEITSKNIVESIRYMALRFGILTSGYLRTPRKGHETIHGDFIEGKKQSYTLRIPKAPILASYLGIQASEKVNYFRFEDVLYSRVEEIKEEHYEGEVFDFNVKGSKTYLTASGGLAHNGGKRKGSIAMYLEPWHADVFQFLELPKEVGPEEIRARDLFLAMWMPDLFFKRAQADEDWSLFCPNEAPGLQDVFGEEFDELYISYEKKGIARQRIKARELLAKICECQIEHGIPYVLAKDTINKKSNQKNIGIIKSSNLCAEITEVSNKDETAVCNLASICLSKFVKKDGEFDFKKLERVTRTATHNLNNVIDRTFYPTEKTKNSNLKHRPIGIGVQGLADVFFQMGLAFDSPEALELDKQIFETMYYSFLFESMELAKKNGPYETFSGSPASQGILQFDMWGVKPSSRYDWDGLKEEIKKYGLRNSLGIALMPTASTASIFGNGEAFEPQKGNIFRREVLSGEFMIVNKHLVKELEKLGLWNTNIKNKIILNNGSVKGIDEIPEKIQNIYKTAYELSQKVIIEHAAARGAFICQSQSMNLFFEDAKMAKLSSAMIFSWERGLKTLNYYIRSKPAARAAKVGLESEPTKEYTNKEAVACSLDNKEACEACGS